MPRPIYSARTADKYLLYQQAVQCPEADIRFIDRVFIKSNGKRPLRLREDFCGTGFLCREWVNSCPDRTAIGVDLDPDVLAWGRKNNFGDLGAGGRRISLIQADVADVIEPTVDVVTALNFSFCVFKRRDALRRYFSAVRMSLSIHGVLFLDIFGGPEGQTPQEEVSKLKGFTYRWDQDRFNPLTNEILCHIHFDFPDGSKLRKAFSYDWRLWSLPELQEVLLEAGFSRVDVYWEGIDPKTGEGNGIFRQTHRPPPDDSWVAYVVGVA